MAQYADQLSFAAGVLIGTSNTLSNPTPRRFGVLQDCQIDFSADLKELYGQGRYAVALAPGKTKVEMKAKFAGIRGALWNELFFGYTTTATQVLFADNESGSIPGSSSYTVTVSNSATWLADQGVFYAATGLPLQRVSSVSAAGQYSVSAGVYTFNSTDASKAVYISYTYSSASGLQIPISNIRMGVGPSFSVVFDQTFDGRQANYVFNNCQCSKLSLPAKQDDWEIFELDFQVAADVAGNIGTINLVL